MASQEFVRYGVRYTPGPEVRFNGIKGRFWDRRKYHRGCWVFQGRQFNTLRETRDDIASELDNVSADE